MGEVVELRYIRCVSVLVFNSGSSSIRYACFDAAGEQRLASGHVAGIGAGCGRFTHDLHDAEAAAGTPGHAGDPCRELRQRIPDHHAGFALALDALGDSAGLTAIGHRVVHGGERFSAPTLIDDAVLDTIRALETLAPLHNPGNRLGIEEARRHFPGLPQVAVFDTAFHHALPPRAHRYALPEGLCREHGLRRYGFHGISHQYLAQRAARLLERDPASLQLITLHLGNGASAAAIAGGRSVDTSMGFTPLEGLVMGTRCGDLDASVPLFLQQQGLAAGEVQALLNTQSGLQGLGGASDMREIERRRAAGDGRAALAFDLFCYRIRKYIGAYLAVLGQVDALVFSGGIGEHSAAVREACTAGLEPLGFELDAARNGRALPDCSLQAPRSRAAVLLIHTDEERAIALQTAAVVAGRAPAAERSV